MAMNTILFIHGFPFDHRMWRHQLAGLAQWECIAPDLRGARSGEVPNLPSAYGMAAYADDLMRVLDRAQIRQAVMCGLSMGGYIIFELLRRHPHRIRAAILCNTKATADSPDAKRGRDALAATAQRGGAAAVATELIPKVLARHTLQQRVDVVREVTEMIERQPVAGIVGALHALRERPDSTPVLSRIQIPVLVIAGDDDQIAPAAGMKEMAEQIPGAEFVVISSAGHLTPLEQPDAVNRVLTHFLTQLRS
jgi:pimeloyl-ACP methyl ester carboxylesterase